MAESVDIPKDLRTKLLSLPNPVDFSLVRSRVQAWAEETGIQIDPIQVATAHHESGLIVLNIPEEIAEAVKSVIEVTPDEDGIFRDKEAIEALVESEKIQEHLTLDAARRLGCAISLGGYKGLLDFLHMDSLWSSRETSSEEAWKKKIENLLKKIVPSMERSIFAPPLDPIFALEESVDAADIDLDQLYAQIKVLAELFPEERLMTPAELAAVTQANKKSREEWEKKEAQERAARKEELDTDPEAAKRWLFGMALNLYQEANGDQAQAARNLAQIKKAQYLIKKHQIDIRTFVKENYLEELERNRNRGANADVLGVILQAFTTRKEAPTLSKNATPAGKCDYILNMIEFWFNAEFAEELPDGAYEQFLRNEQNHSNAEMDRILGPRSSRQGELSPEATERIEKRTQAFLDENEDAPPGKFTPMDIDRILNEFMQEEIDKLPPREEEAIDVPPAAIDWTYGRDFLKWKVLIKEIRSLVYKTKPGKTFDSHFTTLMGALKERIVQIGETQKRLNAVLDHHKSKDEKPPIGLFVNFFKSEEELKFWKMIQEKLNFSFILSQEERQTIIEKNKQQREAQRRSRESLFSGLFSDDWF